MRLLVGLAAAVLLSFSANATDSVTDADARLALQIASGLATSAPADAASADVASSASEGTGARITILDAVQLARGARGRPPEGVNGSGYLRLTDEVQLHGATIRNFTLARAYRFTGRLVDASGNPVSGAISLGDKTDSQKGFAMTGNSGEFAMAVPPGRLRPSVSASFPSEDGEGSIQTVMPLKESDDVSLSADARREFVRPEKPPTGFVTGAISAGDLTAMQVTATVKMGEQAGGQSTARVTDGQYRIECPGGSATLLVEASTGQPRGAQVVFTERDGFPVTAGQTTTHDVSLPPLVKLTGSVRGGPDWPILHLSLANWESHGMWIGSSQYNAARDGFMVLAEPGLRRVRVTYSSYGASKGERSYWMDVHVPEGGGEVVLDVPQDSPERTIAGRVTNPAGQPVQGAKITLVRVDRLGDRSAYAYATTDAAGRYNLTTPEGRYSVIVEPPR